MSVFEDASTLSKDETESGAVLAPRFGPDGLISAVAQDATSGDILMLAHMNAEALQKTIETGIVHYWSRSRQSLWKKGETSGQLQSVVSLLIDCDQDAVVIQVNVAGDGGACHTGRRSCFYRKVVIDPTTQAARLTITER